MPIGHLLQESDQDRGLLFDGLVHDNSQLGWVLYIRMAPK